MAPKIFRASGVIARALDDVLFLAPPGEEARILELNAISCAVWRCLEHPVTLQEIVDVFESAFPNEPRKRLEAEIEAAIAELMSCGCLGSNSCQPASN